MIVFNADTAPEPTGPQPVRWTAVMVSILRENYEALSDEQLGVMIGVKATAVNRQLRELGIIRKSPLQLQKQKKRLELQMQKEKQKREKRMLNDLVVQQEQARKKRNEPKFQTRQQDLSQLRSIRVDHKTWIYIRHDQNPEEAIQRYQRKLTANGLSSIQHSS